MSSIAAQKSSLVEKQTLFFSAQKFAVVGASDDAVYYLPEGHCHT
jgi:hypothetical protein